MDTTSLLPALFGYHAIGVLVAFVTAVTPLVAVYAVIRCRMNPALKALLAVGLLAVWLTVALPYALIYLAFSQEGPLFI